MTPTEAHEMIAKAYRTGRDNPRRKLTPKQTEIIRIMKNVGSQFVSFKDCDMRTYEILVKRGIFTVTPDTMGFGKFYRLTEVQDA